MPCVNAARHALWSFVVRPRRERGGEMPKKVALTSGLRAAERSSAMAKVVEKTRSARAAVF